MLGWEHGCPHQRQKLLGIIGGTGPESTIEYYRLLIAAHRQATPDGSYPHLLLSSIDNQRLLALAQAGEMRELTAYLLREVNRLALAGADLGLFAANTPHIVFEDVESQSPIPLLSIVEATCAEAGRLGMRRAGLFGTRFTMQGSFYPRVFRRAHIQLFVPTPEEQDYIHAKYMQELIPGVFTEETRAQLQVILYRMQEREGIDGLILGGTELPLLLPETQYAGIPLLNTARIHVAAAVERLTA